MSEKIKLNNSTQRREVAAFQKKVLGYYHLHGRHDMPWRTRITPYRVLVSEMMLQQTQVSRVTPKFDEFMKKFPSIRALSNASLSEVLLAWQGLGYNRRAKYLWETARFVTTEYAGKFPDIQKLLSQELKLPGIGPNTAGAIAAYAYDLPIVFIETNIRRGFIHAFFGERSDANTSVSDAQLLPYIQASMERCVRQGISPRTWYWALMDYGSMLGRAPAIDNPNRKSLHYVRQSRFAGSRRQLRGMVLATLLAGTKRGLSERHIYERMSGDSSAKSGNFSIDQVKEVLSLLVTENIVKKSGKTYKIA